MPRLTYMLKTSQLRVDDLCAYGNTASGPCEPDLPLLVGTVVTRARWRP